MIRVYRAFCESHAAFDISIYKFVQLHMCWVSQQHKGIYKNLTMI